MSESTPTLLSERVERLRTDLVSSPEGRQTLRHLSASENTQLSKNTQLEADPVANWPQGWAQGWAQGWGQGITELQNE